MDRLEVKSIIPELIGTKYIGHGKTAFCFVTKDDKIIKVFYNSYQTRELFSIHQNDFLEYLEFLSKFNNRTFYGPEVVITKKNKVIGYKTNYAKYVTVNNISKKTKIDTLIDMFKILELDVLIASQEGLRIGDLHAKNIVVGENFKLIDLDKSTIWEYNPKNNLAEYNLHDLIDTITKAIFNVDDLKNLTFADDKINNLYKKATLREYQAYYDFFSILKDYGENIEDLRRNVSYVGRKLKRYYSQW